MEESTIYEVSIEFKNGRILNIQMLDSEIDTMFDKLWGRDPVKWTNTWEHIINLDEVYYVNYSEKED